MKVKLFKVRDAGGVERFFETSVEALAYRNGLVNEGIDADAYTVAVDMPLAWMVAVLNAASRGAVLPETKIHRVVVEKV